MHRGLMDRELSRCPGGPGSNPAFFLFSDFEEQLEIYRESTYERPKWWESEDDVIRTKTEVERDLIQYFV